MHANRPRRLVGFRYRRNGICHMGDVLESANRADPAVEGVGCDAMTNPLVHAIVLTVAILIPGGLLVYFAWRAARKSISSKADTNQIADCDEFEYIPGAQSDPDEARAAFRQMFPTCPPESLRARSRVRRMLAYRTGRRKKS